MWKILCKYFEFFPNAQILSEVKKLTVFLNFPSLVFSSLETDLCMITAKENSKELVWAWVKQLPNSLLNSEGKVFILGEQPGAAGWRTCSVWGALTCCDGSQSSHRSPAAASEQTCPEWRRARSGRQTVGPRRSPGRRTPPLQEQKHHELPHYLVNSQKLEGGRGSPRQVGSVRIGMEPWQLFMFTEQVTWTKSGGRSSCGPSPSSKESPSRMLKESWSWLTVLESDRERSSPPSREAAAGGSSYSTTRSVSLSVRMGAASAHECQDDPENPHTFSIKKQEHNPHRPQWQAPPPTPPPPQVFAGTLRPLSPPETKNEESTREADSCSKLSRWSRPLSWATGGSRRSSGGWREHSGNAGTGSPWIYPAGPKHGTVWQNFSRSFVEF